MTLDALRAFVRETFVHFKSLHEIDLVYFLGQELLIFKNFCGFYAVARKLDIF